MPMFTEPEDQPEFKIGKNPFPNDPMPSTEPKKPRPATGKQIGNFLKTARLNEKIGKATEPNEDQYHKSERLLNDFKNKRITYTEAIDTIAEWIKASREEALDYLKRTFVYMNMNGEQTDKENGWNKFKEKLDDEIESIRSNPITK